MKIDTAAAATLSAIIESDLAAIARLDAQLQEIHASSPQPDFRDAAAMAYILHNLYNALENSFEHISRGFENNVQDVSQWHKELLSKMFLHIPGIRPAVLPSECRKLLNELRGFRHVFRHSYDFELDTSRLCLLIDDWKSSQDALVNALRSFSNSLLQGDSTCGHG